MGANDRQVGGSHYRDAASESDGEQHWDRIWRLYGAGYFVGCITKYVERYPRKGGVTDLEKAQHYLEKLIELERKREELRDGRERVPAAGGANGMRPGGGAKKASRKRIQGVLGGDGAGAAQPRRRRVGR